MQHRHYPERPLIRRVGNQVIVHTNEAQRPGGKVGAAVALMGKRYESLNSIVNLISYAVGGVDTVLRDKLPQIVNVDISLGMKLKAAHAWLLRRASLFAFSRAKASSPGMSLTLPLLMSS